MCGQSIWVELHFWRVHGREMAIAVLTAHQHGRRTVEASRSDMGRDVIELEADAPLVGGVRGLAVWTEAVVD